MICTSCFVTRRDSIIWRILHNVWHMFFGGQVVVVKFEEPRVGFSRQGGAADLHH